MPKKSLPATDCTDVNTSCSVAKASHLIGDLWTILIVKELLTGAKRFSELEKLINAADEKGDISSRTLTQRLKFLESEEIINRKVFAEVPPRCEYSLTTRGKALSEIVEKIREYGEKYL